MTTAAGAVIRLMVSFCNASVPYHRYRLFGTKGTLETRDVDNETRASFNDIPHLTGEIRMPVGINEPGLSADKALSHGTGDWRMLHTIIDAIVHDTPGGIDVVPCAGLFIDRCLRG